MSSATVNIQVAPERLAAFCRKWGVTELSLFGSVLRDDFRDDSDVDVLVSFAPGHRMTLDTFVDMRDELMALFGREVDLVQQRLIRNPFRRREILSTRKVLYAA